MSTEGRAYKFPNLPIVEHLPAIAAGLRGSSLSILESSPGSGKTTLLPISLLSEEWLCGKSIIMLQPRRLAAKSVALRMADLLHEPIGASVGYQIRLERNSSKLTRIEVITEGLLTRRLLSDPELTGVGLIIFDEFHERSAHADIALGLAQETMAVLRPDLKILIMSATLGSLAGESRFAHAWHYSFESSPFPVQVKYTIPEPRKPIWEEVARVARSAVNQYEGDILAFLPGRYEIQRCQELLESAIRSVDVFPLYSELPFEQQQAAIGGNATDARRIILATPIAETSLTIEGVRIVIDAGLHKVARSESSWSSELTTERITLDSASQRAGRAGRTGPGVCIRLWSESEQATLRPAREPEILRTDITQHILDLYAWGVRDLKQFPWITPPSERALLSANQTLRQLGAIDSTAAITPKGRALASLGTHPRLGALSLAARRFGLEKIAAALITLIEDAQSARPSSGSGVDLDHLIDSLMDDRSAGASRKGATLLYRRWLERINSLPLANDSKAWPFLSADAPGYLLAVAFPERIAKQRAQGQERYLLASGVGATLTPKDPLTRHEYIVIAGLHMRGDDYRISQAVRLNPAIFDTLLSDLVVSELLSYFDEERGTLNASYVERVGALILREQPRQDLSQSERASALVSYLRTPPGHARLPFSDRAHSLRQRVAWAAGRASQLDLPNLSDLALMQSEPFWLEGFIPASAKLSDLSQERIDEALRALFSWNQLQTLDAVAPQSIVLPNGKSRSIDYSESDAPAISAFIQELFGLDKTPTIGQLREPLTLRLLSPARRPMQVTKDLESFWRSGYPLVRKELRGRYPKHKWPEDPTKQNQE